MTTKPDMTYAWAESGSTSNPGSAKVQTGWVPEIPTAEVENWIQNRQDEFLKHLNEHGLPLWDNATDYPVGGYTLLSGVIYVSIQTPNVNKNPSTQTAYWTPLSTLLNSPTTDEKAAMGAANSPDGDNPFATMGDMPDLDFDYDSGWSTVSSSDASKAFTHNLNSAEFTLIQVMLKDANDKPIVVAPSINTTYSYSAHFSQVAGFVAQAASVNEFRLYRATNTLYDGSSNFHHWLPSTASLFQVPNGWASSFPSHIRLKLKV